MLCALYRLLFQRHDLFFLVDYICWLIEGRAAFLGNVLFVLRYRIARHALFFFF